VVVCLAEKGGLPAVGGAQIIMDCNQIISDYQGLYYQIIMDCNQIIIRLSWTVIRLSWTVILRLWLYSDLCSCWARCVGNSRSALPLPNFSIPDVPYPAPLPYPAPWPDVHNRHALSRTTTNSHQEPVSGQACNPLDPPYCFFLLWWRFIRCRYQSGFFSSLNVHWLKIYYQ